VHIIFNKRGEQDLNQDRNLACPYVHNVSALTVEIMNTWLSPDLTETQIQTKMH